jgi:hypothetical protein
MNDMVNPIFDALLERIVNEDEIKQAKTYARAATEGGILPEEADQWMQGQHIGFKL